VDNINLIDTDRNRFSKISFYPRRHVARSVLTMFQPLIYEHDA